MLLIYENASKFTELSNDINILVCKSEQDELGHNVLGNTQTLLKKIFNA